MKIKVKATANISWWLHRKLKSKKIVKIFAQILAQGCFMHAIFVHMRLQNIFKFDIFLHKLLNILPFFALFLAFFWNIACVPLLFRIGPERFLKFYNSITAKYYLPRLYLFINNTLHLFINNSLHKNAVSCEFGHIYRKNPLMENFIFCVVI